MQAENDERLRKLVKEREEYTDFADCIMRGLKTDENKQKMLDFINENPTANDEAIILKLAELRGIKPAKVVKNQ